MTFSRRTIFLSKSFAEDLVEYRAVRCGACGAMFALAATTEHLQRRLARWEREHEAAHAEAARTEA